MSIKVLTVEDSTLIRLIINNTIRDMDGVELIGTAENGTVAIEKIKELKLETTDYPRTLGIVAPYTAKEFNSNSYVSRIAVPIKDFKE